jgi:ABC-type branched-subunit amino acid transport system substrate-binding protein
MRLLRMRQMSQCAKGLRFRGLGLCSTAAAFLLLAGCGAEGIPGLSGGTATGGGTQVSLPAGQTLGTGSVKIALLLPFSAPESGTLAQDLRNAAELALSESKLQAVTIILKDDQGSAAGASTATREAIAEGAELILGPLFASAVAAAGPVAKTAGKPMIALSNDDGVAQPGVYLLSFLPQADVSRVVSYAGSKGKKRFVVLAPQDAYGDAIVPAAESAVASISGGEIVTVQRYASGGLSGAIAAASAQISGADALLIADDGAIVASAAAAISSAAGSKVQLLGTGRWNSAAALAAPELANAWFPAPDPAGFSGFSNRYQAKFGAAPSRVATLAYDAVALANVLTQAKGDQRFSTGVLQEPSGFDGQDGVFRFRSDGTNNRALAVFQIRNGAPAMVSPAPESFARRGT